MEVVMSWHLLTLDHIWWMFRHPSYYSSSSSFLPPWWGCHVSPCPSQSLPSLYYTLLILDAVIPWCLKAGRTRWVQHLHPPELFLLPRLLEISCSVIFHAWFPSLTSMEVKNLKPSNSFLHILTGICLSHNGNSNAVTSYQEVLESKGLSLQFISTAVPWGFFLEWC